MADVFISYARADRVSAAQLAEALESRGWTVWWDPRIRAGEVFDEAIEREIAAAGCVVALWSRTSVASEWVRAEASAAAERGVLIPARLDGVQPPIEFRRRQTVDLSAWNGSPSHPGLRELTDAVADRVAPHENPGAATPLPSPPKRSGALGFASKHRWRLPTMLGLAAGVLAALVGTGIGIGGWSSLVKPQPATASTASSDMPPGIGMLDFRWSGDGCWYVYRGDVKARYECGAGRHALQAGDYIIRPSSYAAFEPQRVTIRAGVETRLDPDAGTLDFRWPGKDCWYAYRGDVKARSQCGAGQYVLQTGDYVLKPWSKAAFEPIPVRIRKGQTTTVP